MPPRRPARASRGLHPPTATVDPPGATSPTLVARMALSHRRQSLVPPRVYAEREHLRSDRGQRHRPVGLRPLADPANNPVILTCPARPSLREFLADTMMVNGTALSVCHVAADGGPLSNPECLQRPVAEPLVVFGRPGRPERKSGWLTRPRIRRIRPGRLTAGGGVPDPTTQGPPWDPDRKRRRPPGAGRGDYAAAGRFRIHSPGSPLWSVTSHSLLLFHPRSALTFSLTSPSYGKTACLILYNDAPGTSAFPWPINRLLYGQRRPENKRRTAYNPPGFGPNIRTVMQIRVTNTAPSPAFDLASLQAALPQAYKATQAPPIVPQAAYNAAFGTAYTGILFVQEHG